METKAFLFGIILTTVAVLLDIALMSTHVSAQQNTTASVGTNFTKLLAGKEFRHCVAATLCSSTVDVVYQGRSMLVFKSFYEDIIWKAVELAKEKGYKIDGMYTFTTVTGDPPSGDVNFIVAMSKG